MKLDTDTVETLAPHPPIEVFLCAILLLKELRRFAKINKATPSTMIQQT